MKTIFKFYVVDSIAESIIGSFEAVSLDMAKMIMKKSILDNEKLKDSVDQFVLYKDPFGINVCETFNEVKDTLVAVDNHDWVVINK